MPMFLIIQATAAASEGRLKESGRIYSTAAGRLQSSDHGTAASMTLGQIVNEEWCGKYDRIEDRVTAVIPNAQGNRDALSMAAIGLSLARRPERARALIDDLAKRYPKDTLVNEVLLPVVNATAEIGRGNPARAIELLQVARPFEFGGYANYWPNY